MNFPPKKLMVPSESAPRELSIPMNGHVSMFQHGFALRSNKQLPTKLWEAVHLPWEAVPERKMKNKVTFFQ
jgi:hypothetical protein